MSKNPLAGSQAPKRHRKYLPLQAHLWIEAVRLQHARCSEPHDTDFHALLDMSLYVVAAQRLREIARMAAERFDSPVIGEILAKFDTSWPHLKNLRDLQEHMLVPKADPPRGHFGLAFFGNSIADLRPSGEVVDIVSPRDTTPDLETLYTDLCQQLGSVG
jgi:hypothetical protein